MLHQANSQRLSVPVPDLGATAQILSGALLRKEAPA